MAEKTCGKCDHYEGYKQTWGYCRCPVPAWVVPDLNMSTALVDGKDSKAEKCPCFKAEAGEPVALKETKLPKTQKIFSEEKPKKKRGRKPKKGEKK